MGYAYWINEPFVQPVVYAQAIVSYLKEKFPEREYLIDTKGVHPLDSERKTRIQTIAVVRRGMLFSPSKKEVLLHYQCYEGCPSYMTLSARGATLAQEDLDHILERFSLRKGIALSENNEFKHSEVRPSQQRFVNPHEGNEHDASR